MYIIVKVLRNGVVSVLTDMSYKDAAKEYYSCNPVRDSEYIGVRMYESEQVIPDEPTFKSNEECNKMLGIDE